MTLKGPFLLWTPCLYISNMGDNEEEYKFSVEEQMEDYVDVAHRCTIFLCYLGCEI